ncbi:hypothetical protein [Methylibium sp.]|uniref:hypothetical protein n=1 Tax=Methylibium sp. TaxID=2067992 RepID=UPI003BAA1162
MKKLTAVMFALALSGCATQLTDAGSKVRVVTEQQRPGCQFVKLVSAQADLGPDKPGSALKKAMNEVAAVGGNGLFLVTNTVHWFDGASVTGEALKCQG